MGDPAVLLYTSDFTIGTLELTDEEVGQYIRLLCYQHQKGHINLKIIHKIIDSELSENVLKKFTTDSDGNYFNERMELETNKRHNYCESRRKNRAK